MECRKCGACCIAPSISSPIPGMPNGKLAMTACVNLDESMKCTLWDSADRPLVCQNFKPDSLFCGINFKDAIKILSSLE